MSASMCVASLTCFGFGLGSGPGSGSGSGFGSGLGSGHVTHKREAVRHDAARGLEHEHEAARADGLEQPAPLALLPEFFGDPHRKLR